MADEKKPKLTTVGDPAPETEQPVAPHDPGSPRGARQDGAGAGVDREQRSDDVPPGATNDVRRGPRQGTGSRDPFEAHRGNPADMKTGAAGGSGAATGGTDAGMGEDPDPDKGGGGRPEEDTD